MKCIDSYNITPYHSFVCPDVCQTLVYAGLDAKPVFWWSIQGKVAELVTYWFDKDNYYAGAAREIHEVNKPIIIPAFEMADMEHILPGAYLLNRNGLDGYELSMEGMWQVQSVKGFRMPDVFATMVLQLIQLRMLDMKKVVQTVNSYAGSK